jgi:hypothetical protein
VARNAKPTPRAAILKRFLSIIILAEISGSEYRSSDVIKSIIAVTASHKLISDNDKGKLICITLARCDTTLLWLSRQETRFVSELLQSCQKFLQ